MADHPFRTSLAMKYSIHGRVPMHFGTLASFCHLGSVYESRGKLIEAENVYWEVFHPRHGGISANLR